MIQNPKRVAMMLRNKKCAQCGRPAAALVLHVVTATQATAAKWHEQSACAEHAGLSGGDEQPEQLDEQPEQPEQPDEA